MWKLHMVIHNIFFYFHYFIYVSQAYYSTWYDVFSKSKNSNDVLVMYEHLCTMIHSFCSLNFWIMTMWNLLKKKFAYNRFETFETF
jgi:hypothetical protein